ncbi:exported hypothetical protein [Pseudoclavibacter sp. 8L]|nr:exported hypothetical protein [Pseudoclavibacter sp. 8L]
MPRICALPCEMADSFSLMVPTSRACRTSARTPPSVTHCNMSRHSLNTSTGSCRIGSYVSPSTVAGAGTSSPSTYWIGGEAPHRSHDTPSTGLVATGHQQTMRFEHFESTRSRTVSHRTASESRVTSAVSCTAGSFMPWMLARATDCDLSVHCRWSVVACRHAHSP